MDGSIIGLNDFWWYWKRVPTSNVKFCLLECSSSESKQNYSLIYDLLLRTPLWYLVDLWHLFIIFRRSQRLPKRQLRLYGAHDHIPDIWRGKNNSVQFRGAYNVDWTTGDNFEKKNFKTKFEKLQIPRSRGTTFAWWSVLHMLHGVWERRPCIIA